MRSGLFSIFCLRKQKKTKLSLFFWTAQLAHNLLVAILASSRVKHKSPGPEENDGYQHLIITAYGQPTQGRNLFYGT